MSSHVIEDLTSSILDFQANEARIILRRKYQPVDPIVHIEHFNALRYIWTTSKLEEEEDLLVFDVETLFIRCYRMYSTELMRV